jgi:hypothetical protein
MLDLDLTIRTAVVTAAPNSWPTYDGKNLKRWQYITASEANKCLRELAFAKTDEMNTKAIPDYWDVMTDEQFNREIKKHGNESKLGIFARGHHVEAWVVKQLELMADPSVEDYDLLGDNQISFYSDKFKVSGTPDGIHFDKVTRELTLLEFKSSASYVSEPRSSHVAQVQVNMGLIMALAKQHGDKEFASMMGWEFMLDANGELPVFVGAKVLYTDPGNYMKMQDFFVPYDDGAYFGHVISRSWVLFNETGEPIPPSQADAEGLSNNGCFFCPKKADCRLIESAAKHSGNAEKLAGMIDGVVPKMPDFPKFKKESTAEVVAAFDEYADAQDTKKLADAVMAHVRPFLTEWLLAQDGIAASDFDHESNHYSGSFTTSERIGSVSTEDIDTFLAAQGLAMRTDDFRKPSSKVETLRVTRKMRKA